MRLRTMVKNRIVTVFDRWLAQVKVSEIDRMQIDRGLAFVGDINERIRHSEATIRAMTKANANVKLLKTIPGIGEFFARLTTRRRYPGRPDDFPALSIHRNRTASFVALGSVGPALASFS